MTVSAPRLDTFLWSWLIWTAGFLAFPRRCLLFGSFSLGVPPACSPGGLLGLRWLFRCERDRTVEGQRRRR
jgi:hypothetical protein